MHFFKERNDHIDSCKTVAYSESGGGGYKKYVFDPLRQVIKDSQIINI